VADEGDLLAGVHPAAVGLHAGSGAEGCYIASESYLLFRYNRLGKIIPIDGIEDS